MTTDYASRLAALRAALAAAGYDGFLVPMTDEYQSEYVPASSRRIEYLSGFTGSSGFAAVLRDKAAFFTDGRYTLQAAGQIPAALFEIHDSAAKSPADWLAENLGAGAKLAYDPWLHTDDGVARLRKALTKCGAEMVAVERNPIDALWKDRPAPPAEPVYPYDIAYAGQASADKRAAIAAELKKLKFAAAIVADPASVAWLLNVRGGDVPNTPLPLGFAIIEDSGKVTWFVEPKKITDGLSRHLGPEVILDPPQNFAGALDRLGAAGKPVRIDLKESASWIAERLRKAGAKLDDGEDPSALPRACKNAVELDGMRNCHRRDGAALVSFFAWLDGQTPGSVTELDAEAKLASFRAANNLYRGPSFDTIAGAGAHGAIVHYRATAATNARLEEGQLFLLDSGGQYLDGTTDVTRTIALGSPSDEMRDRFTRVLKGHIALASIRFPEGTTGADLDVLARQHLWAAGLDFNHGTGHGVGSYLGVHEGPQGVSKRNKIALRPGMVVSNEPGYYKAGYYGIRIENLQAVIALPNLSDERKMLGFETITLVPIDRRLIQPTLLTQEEEAWLAAYHLRVYDNLGPMLSAKAKAWLVKMTGITGGIAG
jgi:Xaa-Pro aminopeptidase